MPSKHKLWRLCVLLLLVAGLSACASGPAPVDSRYQRAEYRPSSYVVRKGDTLYSIAFRFGLNYQQLARVNGIGRDYLIVPGQTLSLNVAAVSPMPSKVKSSSSRPLVSSSQPATNTVRKSTAPKVTKPASSRPAPAAVPKSHVSSTWQWPVRGKILKRFKVGSATDKGIDIAVKTGATVVAARDGKVVYAGNGLPGYGNLLIIKHDAEYLSAYAHNSALLVKEGDLVKAGGKVASAGSSGTTSSRLHFEIRRAGKPVDPLTFLPK